MAEAGQVAENGIGPLLERFHNCFDGLIRACAVFLPSDRSSRRAVVVLSARDSESQAEDGWVNLRFELTGLVEYRLEEPANATYQVLSDGIQLAIFGDIVYLDLAPESESSTSAEDVRRSRLYVAAKCCSWAISEYEEAPTAAALEGGAEA